jgi:hypothetical protein
VPTRELLLLSARLAQSRQSSVGLVLLTRDHLLATVTIQFG